MMEENINLEIIIDSAIDSFLWYSVVEVEKQYIQNLLLKIKCNPTLENVNLLKNSPLYKNLPYSIKHHINIRLEYLEDLNLIQTNF